MGDPARTLASGSVGPIIAEELLLLTYRPERMRPARGIRLEAALAAGVLAELVLDGHAELVDGRVVATGSGEPPDHPALAKALKRVAKKPRRPDTLVPGLTERLRLELLRSMVSRGVLLRGWRWTFGVVPCRAYPVVSAAEPDRSLERLRAAVLASDGRGVPDGRAAVLACLVQGGKLTPRLFPESDYERADARLTELTEGNWIVDAVRKASQAKIIAEVVATAVYVVVTVLSSPST